MAKPTIPLEQAVTNAGLKVHLFARAMGLTWERVSELREGRFPSNHPYIPRLAKYLQLPQETMQNLYCGGPPITKESTLKSLTTRLARIEKGAKKAVILHPTESEPAKARRGHRVLATVQVSNGNGRHAPVKRRNALKRGGHNLRQSVRGMLETTNIAVLRGERYVTNIPTEALYLVLTDYAERCGIKHTVVLHPKFAELFD